MDRHLHHQKIIRPVHPGVPASCDGKKRVCADRASVDLAMGSRAKSLSSSMRGGAWALDQAWAWPRGNRMTVRSLTSRPTIPVRASMCLRTRLGHRLHPQTDPETPTSRQKQPQVEPLPLRRHLLRQVCRQLPPRDLGLNAPAAARLRVYGRGFHQILGVVMWWVGRPLHHDARCACRPTFQVSGYRWRCGAVRGEYGNNAEREDRKHA